jgi:hypothetical protein
MTEYLIVEYPDGAQYAVPADRLAVHPGARVVGREHPTGIPAPVPEPEAEAAVREAAAPTSEPQPAPAPAA